MKKKNVIRKQQPRKTSVTRTAVRKPAPKRKAKPVAVETPAVPVPAAPIEERGPSKKDVVIGLLQREGGATLDDLMTATGWQQHSVRGFLSTIKKKLGLAVERVAGNGTATVYRIVVTSVVSA